MSRRVLAALLFALSSAPSFGAAVEAVRVEASPAVLSAPSAATASILAPSLGALTAPAALAASAPSFAAVLPVPVLAPAPALAASLLPAASVAVAPSLAPSLAAARGPPSSPRSASGVAARVADAVRSWGAPIEQIFSGHDVLLVGENHGSLESVATLTRAMPRLAAAGVKAVGIEGLKRPHQEEVDAFVSGRTDELPDAALSFSPRRRAAFRALLAAARENGVRVVALGLPLDEWARQAAALAARKTGRPVSDFAGTTDAQFERATSGYEPGFNEAVAEVYLTRRNRAMASFLLDALKAGGKAVVLVGQAHVEGLDMVPGRLMNAPGKWGTLASELSKLALKAFSLTSTGGLFIDADAGTMDRQARPESYRAAAAFSPKGAPAYEALGPDRGLWHAGGRTPASLAR